MSSKIVLFVFLFLFADFFSENKIHAQYLLKTPSLNAGGYVKDVFFDPANDYFYVVGSFICAGKKNFMALTKDPFSDSLKVVTSFSPITSINGPVYSVVRLGTRIFIGGQFTTINGVSNINGFARFNVTGSNAVLETNTTLFPLMDPGAEVRDMEVVGTTLYATGAFTTCGDSSRNGYFAYSSGRNPKAGDIHYSLYGGPPWDMVMSYPDMYLLCDPSTTDLDKFNVLTNVSDISFDPNLLVGAYWQEYTDLDILGDTILVTQNFVNGDYQFTAFDRFSGNSLSFYGTHFLPALASVVYDDQVYSLRAWDSLVRLDVSRPISAVNYQAYVEWSITQNGHLSGSEPYISIWSSINTAENYLFVSDNDLTAFGGNTRIGYGVFMLSPYRPLVVQSQDTLVCPGQQNVTYKIASPKYSEKCVWYYTGTGVSINNSGLMDTVTSSLGSSTISVDFDDNFTPGQLKVYGYSLPYPGAAGINSDTLIINIYRNPVPDAQAGTDVTLNCAISALGLSGSSVTPSASFSWSGPSSFSASTANITVSNPGNYVLTITEPVYGCSNRDTVLVAIDTVKPNVTLPTANTHIDCNDPGTILDGSSTTPNTVLYWRDQSTGDSLPDPANIGMLGTYWLIVENTVNGCLDSAGIVVSQNFDVPNYYFPDYPAYTMGTPLDTLSCLHTSAGVLIASDTAGAILQWIDTANQTVLGNPFSFGQGGFYLFTIAHPVSGCMDTIPVFIAENFAQPGLIMPFPQGLNCSFSSVIMDADSIASGSLMQWTGPSGYVSSDPALISNPGYYTATAVHPESGCSDTDSILITLTPTISLEAGNDTLVCDGTVLSYTAQAIGTFPGTVWSWSNGTPDSTTTFSVSGNETLIVSLSASNGCSGSDTIQIRIPDVPQDSIAAFRPCGDIPNGSLVVYLSGGIGPFTYSLDAGVNWQSSSVFAGLDYGNYNIQVKDSVGCIYTFGAAITETSSSLLPSFLVPTYNFTGDTIVAVNTSNPPPDSLVWIFPLNAMVIDSSLQAPAFAIGDTGIYTITLRAYYGNCFEDTSKTLFIREQDSSIAGLLNQAGIKTLELYPNPNTGNFSVRVELYKKQNIHVMIHDMVGYTYFSNELEETDLYFQNISLSSAQNGTYLLKVVAEFDSAYLQFVIAR